MEEKKHKETKGNGKVAFTYPELETSIYTNPLSGNMWLLSSIAYVPFGRLLQQDVVYVMLLFAFIGNSG